MLQVRMKKLLYIDSTFSRRRLEVLNSRRRKECLSSSRQAAKKADFQARLNIRELSEPDNINTLKRQTTTLSALFLSSAAHDLSLSPVYPLE